MQLWAAHLSHHVNTQQTWHRAGTNKLQLTFIFYYFLDLRHVMKSKTLTENMKALRNSPRKAITGTRKVQVSVEELPYSVPTAPMDQPADVWK